MFSPHQAVAPDVVPVSDSHDFLHQIIAQQLNLMKQQLLALQATTVSAPSLATDSFSPTFTADSVNLPAFSPTEVPVLIDEPSLPLPLTKDQQDIWLASQYSETASCAFNEGVVVVLPGAVNVPFLQKAVAEGVFRHSAPFMQFSKTGDEQQRSEKEKIAVPLRDLSKLLPAKQTRRINNLIAEAATTPFNLSQDVLLRAQIFKLNDESFALHLMGHHIAIDGWSNALLIGDIQTIYNALCQQETPQLPAPNFYSDYVQGQEIWEKSEVGQANLKFWLDHLSPPPPLLNLPEDQPRPHVKSFQGGSVKWNIEPTVVQAAKQTARRQHTTFFGLLLTAFNIHMWRLSGQSDIVVGIPVAGQPLVDMPNLVGHSLHFMPFRTQLTGEMFLPDLLHNTRSRLLDAQEHQPCGLGTIVEAMELPRNLSRMPLVDVALNLDPPMPPLDFAGISATVQKTAKQAVAWDMFWDMKLNGDTLVVDCDYNTDVFAKKTIEAWLGEYEALVAKICRHPEQILEQLIQ